MFAKILLKHWWKMLFFVAAAAIVMLWINIFVFKFTHRDALWKEELMLPFYFTYISNMFALGIGFVKGFTRWGKGREVKVIEIMGFVNLLVTFLIYWSVLFPLHPRNTTPGWITNLLAHLFVPLIYIGLFLIQNIKDAERHNFNVKKNSMLHMIFLNAYAAVAIILYFSLGGTKSDAVYSFVAFMQNPWWLSVVMIAGLFVIYYWLTYFTYILVNKYNKKINAL